MRKLRPSLGSMYKIIAGICIAGAGWGASATIPKLNQPAYAAAALPKLDSIRVALFVDTGKYNVTASYVTLSSDQGLNIAYRGSAGADKQVFAVDGKTPAAVSLDGYRALLWEGSDAASAKALVDKLTASNESPVVLAASKLGQTVYQVTLGPYATKEAAAAALSKASAGAAAGGALKGFAPSVKGPLHWNAGVYASEAEADAQAAAVGAAGFDAGVAYIAAGAGAPAYAVLAGAAADEKELAAVKQQLSSSLPSAVLQPLDASAAYILKRNQLDVTSQPSAPMPHYMAGGAGAKLAVTAGGQGTVTVKERFGRAYRGALEISPYNGKLAVINELPFEQYLVSVISSELSKDWPKEALKAQAVAARTYALKQGMKYAIAHVSDSTQDQAYQGAGAEFAAAAEAVQATTGEVLTDKSGLIEPLFYSNAGGMTADSSEVWGNKVDYLKSAPSPDDGAEKGKAIWYLIVLPNGQSGYIHSDYARDTGQKNAAGLPYYESNGTGVSVRPAPYVDNAANPASFKVDIGDRFVVIDQAVESNAYSWIRGPFDASKLKDKVNSVLPKPIAGSLDQLEVSKRGESGRVIEMAANGQVMKPAYPDAYRTLLNNLPSTRFDIEDTGRYTILGAGNTVRSQSPASPGIYVASGSDKPQQQTAAQLFIMNGDNKARLKDKQSRYIFKGTGYGHGLGLSQWGAKGYAELGYDYKKILQTYYVGVSITKE
ncbi:SpoIID/LytB domain-containing protein [Paenibacillus doosanensis]|uniref:SpoIID/LytB domain-containing protein n=1 Tax=Paenibacillus doosanensis TaxID=1229154 RepID=UPI002180221D|nr:SpoIID/LytB domain-containing protein [Paenibacillus doosanensis]